MGLLQPLISMLSPLLGVDESAMGNVVGGLIMVAILGMVFLAVVYAILSIWGSGAYQYILTHPKTNCDIDEFVKDDPNPATTVNPVKCALAHRFRLGWRVPRHTTIIPLECVPSKHVKGLWIARNAAVKHEEDKDTAKPLADLLPRQDQTPSASSSSKKTVIVATIRMGFGHHRLAYSACSWSLQQGHTTIFHDLLAIDSEESELLKSIDVLYSKFSRLASELGGPMEKLWGLAMKQGDANALRIASMTATHLQPLLLAYPKDIPMICTHQLVALTAAAVGFTNVINLVVDNYPQWFLVVPKTLNIVQGPVNYQSFYRMGVPSKYLKWAGHWCPHDLVSNIPVDCSRRIQRATVPSPSTAGAMPPKRFLIPVGGAGAQKTFIVQFIQAVSELIQLNQLELLLNAGDHGHMKDAFVEVLDKCNLKYDTVTSIQGVYDLQSKLIQQDASPSTNTTHSTGAKVTLCTFDHDYFAAVATTDILCRVADVLVCKPSELAFYPIPKLHIRRVGDHEADSARRAAELGDGTMECRTIESAMTVTKLLLQTATSGTTSSPWLVQMNQAIINQHAHLETYHGCQRAVEWAVQGATSE